MMVRIRRPAKGATFVHPVDPAPRTAILAPGFRPTKLFRGFPEGWSDQVRRFVPASLAGPVDQLLRAANEGFSIDRAIVVFTYSASDGLSPENRELLWRALGVPIFEQYLSPANTLLATECEAHSGLHVVSGCEGLPLEDEPCPCGHPAPRLMRGPRIEQLIGLLA